MRRTDGPGWVQDKSPCLHSHNDLPPPRHFVLPLPRLGTVRLEEVVLPVGHATGFEPIGVLVNKQGFTKTANIYSVSSNKKGTNSNGIVLFRKFS